MMTTMMVMMMAKMISMIIYVEVIPQNTIRLSHAKSNIALG